MAAVHYWKRLKMKLDENIKSLIEEQAGNLIKSILPLSGGCISRAYRLGMNSGENYFLKLNYNISNDMFIKEAHGLSELRRSAAIRIPKVYLFNTSFLLTEFIAPGNKSKSFDHDFGVRFAEMHKFHGSSFGFYEDNYIGSNIQKNIPDGDENFNWAKFYFNKRILFQYKLAEKNGYATQELKSGIAALEKRIENILYGSEEPPALLHGDLWGGNYIVDENGNACLIDPAVYYGHREADLAMTKLFGGFNSKFYDSYNDVYPLAKGYSYRENIYKLYHVLNHLNLFGSGYYSQAVALINFYIK